MCMIEEADSSCSVGETYRYCFLVYDGFAGSYHSCRHCIIAEDWLVEHCRGFLFGAVEEDIANHLRFGPWSADENRQCIIPDLPAKLVVGMRRKWRRFDKSGLMSVPHAV